MLARNSYLTTCVTGLWTSESSSILLLFKAVLGWEMAGISTTGSFHFTRSLSSKQWRQKVDCRGLTSQREREQGKDWMILPWAGCQAEGRAAVSQMKVHSTPAHFLVMSSPLRKGHGSTAGFYLHFISMTELFIFSVKQRWQKRFNIAYFTCIWFSTFFFFKLGCQCQNVTKIKHRVTFCALPVSGNN